MDEVTVVVKRSLLEVDPESRKLRGNPKEVGFGPTEAKAEISN
jgi:hypothetical protein